MSTSDEQSGSGCGCGWEWDHELNLVDEVDGIRVYECRGCGAEITQEDE